MSEGILQIRKTAKSQKGCERSLIKCQKEYCRLERLQKSQKGCERPIIICQKECLQNIKKGCYKQMWIFADS